MRSEQFQPQVSRLVEQFGKTAYGTERCKLIWQEVQSFEIQWFEKVVDKFIGESRQPPLMPEFREEIARERERLWQIEKKKNAAEAKDFFEGSYQPEDKKLLCEKIRRRIQHKISDQDWHGFMSVLKNVADSSNKVRNIRECSQCNNTGHILDELNYYYRCRCVAGSRLTGNDPFNPH